MNGTAYLIVLSAITNRIESALPESVLSDHSSCIIYPGSSGGSRVILFLLFLSYHSRSARIRFEATILPESAALHPMFNLHPSFSINSIEPRRIGFKKSFSLR